jgi:3(or 17)beta-hydroxysteroid dehydrogenase
MLVDGKVAIVTGAGNGLGQATARRFVEQGGSVVLAEIDTGAGEAAAAAIGGNARFFQLDVWNDDNWAEAVEFAYRTFGAFDVLVNNAATTSLQPIEDVTMDEWLRVFQVNAGGVMLGCKHAIISMKETGGAIINVSSNSSLAGMANIPSYSSSKAAINALTRSIAARCRQEGWPIRCNTVAPGGMVSKMLRETYLELAGVDLGEDTAEAAALIKSGNLVDPTEVADLIIFLSSNAARRVNGAEILADGGDAVIFNPAG